MRVIKPSASVVDERNPFLKVEMAGRTCYKSDSELTEESAIKFYRRLVKSKHTAMLEHATFVFKVSKNIYNKARKEKYLNTTYENGRCLVSGNLRAINEAKIIELKECLSITCSEDLWYEHNPEDVYCSGMSFCQMVDLADFKDLTETEFKAHYYLTFKFITSRGVTHEMCRHRDASFAQESTRYCNYSQGKFNSEITVIEPLIEKDSLQYSAWYDGCIAAEQYYFAMLNAGATTEEARGLLPTDLKAEIIMTANSKEWEHFLNLRSRGTTGKPHPEIKRVADIVLDVYEQRKHSLLK